MFAFRPSVAVRKLDLRAVENKVIKVLLQHTDQSEKVPVGTSQYCAVNGSDLLVLCGVDLHVSGWVSPVMGEPGTTIDKKIVEAWLLTHSNFGRGSKRAKSYAEFFDEAQKAKVFRNWGQTFEDRITHGSIERGDPERCDVSLRFEDGVLLEGSTGWEIEAPRDWYSELHCGDERFKFTDGFFESADAAIDHFVNKSHQDLFGTRYFPVVVFPLSTSNDDIADVTWRPKTCSSPIVVGDRVVIGTRCKSHEYAETIVRCYQVGGAVAKGLEWDW